ncbi:hypothetical protein HOK51_07640 [Candidatus Woesearchaeota archaeon]|jgi:hypothetical protein|nr:hypothetical protein [Candidatus Woesearchaeota archaeon]MBT6519696.1 hypothetical protein [Candidatus Woesearchaeota archaeon]MBT7367387.1 hypothetical protein [Candidatus Woesearchaeota archaeon]
MNQTNLALKKLKGIRPRGVKVKKNSNLESLLDLHQRVWNEFQSAEERSSRNNNSLRAFISHNLSNYFFQNKHKFTEDDLTGFVFSTGNYTDIHSRFTGIFSGVLLDYLVSNNQRKNKRTLLYLDGNGISYPYLFSRTQNIDVLVINNFSGNCICNSIIPFPGCANLLVGLNLKGDFAFRKVRNSNAKVGLVGGYNIQGSDSFSINSFYNSAWIIGENVGDKKAIVNLNFDSFENIHKAKQVMDLIKSIPDKPYDEVIKTALEIESIYKSTLTDKQE